MQVLTELKDPSLLPVGAQLMSSNIEAELRLELEHFKEVKRLNRLLVIITIVTVSLMIIITIILHSGIPAATVTGNFLEFQQRLSIVIPSNTWATRIRSVQVETEN